MANGKWEMADGDGKWESCIIEQMTIDEQLAYLTKGCVDVVRAGEHTGGEVEDLGNVAILPGLVNAHTHLELSYLRDVIAPSSRFVDWIAGIMAARRR